MKKYSYFFNKGKGTYGLSNEQISKADVYINYKIPDLSVVESLIKENERLKRKVENVQQTIFYNRIFITYDLLEDFSNSPAYSTSPIYYNQVNGVGRLIVDTTKINIDFKDTTIFIKDSIESGSITTRNRRFLVIGESQPAYGNYVWYTCEYVPSNAYAYDNLGSYMPNNSTWFLGYQREKVTSSIIPPASEDIEKGDFTPILFKGSNDYTYTSQGFYIRTGKRVDVFFQIFNINGGAPLDSPNFSFYIDGFPMNFGNMYVGNIDHSFAQIRQIENWNVPFHTVTPYFTTAGSIKMFFDYTDSIANTTKSNSFKTLQMTNALIKGSGTYYLT